MSNPIARPAAGPVTHNLAFVVVPDFSNMGLALAIEPLFVANWLAQKPLFRWQVLSLDGLSVRASNGMHLPVDGALGEIGTYDTVFVVASFNAKVQAEDQRRAILSLDGCPTCRRYTRVAAHLAVWTNGSYFEAQQRSAWRPLDPSEAPTLEALVQTRM